LADADIPVFIQGESGTGKELVADAIHYNSPRKKKPLIRVNCGAIPPELFESEFFGYRKGAFTGAVSDKEGKFGLANGGTLFLDEIADLPKVMQVKLLRVLDDGKFTRVGGTKEEKTDLRIISATNKDIGETVRNEDFREDLFYRLVHAEIRLPRLRDRGNDRILIAEHIVGQLNRKHNKKKVPDKSAIDRILAYHWPGNIRQLKNVLETAYVLSDNGISAEDMNIVEIGTDLGAIVIPDGGIDLSKDILPKYYKAALEKTGGNAEQATKLLRLKPHAFRARLKKLDLSRGDF